MTFDTVKLEIFHNGHAHSCETLIAYMYVLAAAYFPIYTVGAQHLPLSSQVIIESYSGNQFTPTLIIIKE